MQIRHDDVDDLCHVTFSGKRGAGGVSPGLTVDLNAPGAQIVEMPRMDARRVVESPAQCRSGFAETFPDPVRGARG